MNTLFPGDSLRIVRESVHDASIDLIYADPPTYPTPLSFDSDVLPSQDSALKSLRSLLHSHDASGEALTDYSLKLSEHLVEWRRVLTDTGSMYLHCTTESALHVRLAAQAVFGAHCFRNELVWRNRRIPQVAPPSQWPITTERILYFSKSDNARLVPAHVPPSDALVRETYKYADQHGRYRLESLLHSASGERPSLKYEFAGFERTWRYSFDRMEQLKQEGRIHQETPTALPHLKRYLAEYKGPLVGDLWEDIPLLGSSSSEYANYPNQRPLQLAERIVQASCPEKGRVLDPFCGSGTTLVAAQRQKRQWIGIDNDPIAISIAQYRLSHDTSSAPFVVAGEPTTLHDVESLASQNPLLFEAWVVGRLGWTPAKDSDMQHIDGQLQLFDDPESVLPNYAVLEVKRHFTDIGDVLRLLERIGKDRAVMAVVVSLDQPTQEIGKVIAETGDYKSPSGQAYPRLQWLTAEQILRGDRPKVPSERK